MSDQQDQVQTRKESVRQIELICRTVKQNPACSFRVLGHLHGNHLTKMRDRMITHGILVKRNSEWFLTDGHYGAKPDALFDNMIVTERRWKTEGTTPLAKVKTSLEAGDDESTVQALKRRLGNAELQITDLSRAVADLAQWKSEAEKIITRTNEILEKYDFSAVSVD